MIQLMETENNMRVLSELIPEIDGSQYQSDLVLYNYDAFLFDFNIEDGLDYLHEVKNTLEQDGKLLDPIDINAPDTIITIVQ